MKLHYLKYLTLALTGAVFAGILPNLQAEGERPTLVMLIAEDEYEHARKLPVFAEEFLAANFNVVVLLGSETESDRIPGLEKALPEADAVLISIRRRPLRENQMNLLRHYIQNGGPIVGIRTASHAFATRGGSGNDEWRQFDPEVLGGNYSGHHNNKNFGDPAETTYIRIVHEKRDHPILRGIPAESEIATRSWLYNVLPLAEGSDILMMGRVGNRLPHEPVAWTNTHFGGGRVFYTSNGHPDDFDQNWFTQLLRNGIYWAAGLESFIPHEG